MSWMQKTGDGDTGSTLAGAARALIASMDTLPLADHTQLYRAIGQELSQTMGGSSGVLLAIFFAAAGDAASSGLSMTGALKAGSPVCRRSGAQASATGPWWMRFTRLLTLWDEGLSKAAQAARAGADHTANAGQGKCRPGLLHQCAAA